MILQIEPSKQPLVFHFVMTFRAILVLNGYLVRSRRGKVAFSAVGPVFWRILLLDRVAFHLILDSFAYPTAKILHSCRFFPCCGA